MTRLSIIISLALTGGFACGAVDAPAHIVQPLPPELDPRLEPAFQPPAGIVHPLTAEEAGQRARDLAPVASAPLREEGLKAITAYDAQDREADEQIRGFRQQYNVAIHTAAADVRTEAAPSTPQDAAKPPPTNITCDEGVYFDMKEGLLVYMKNVHVRNPSLSLDCTGPLKIYLEYVEKDGKKKPSERQKEAGKKVDESQPKLPNDGNFDFNSVKKVAASGNVVIHYTDKKGDTRTAKADKITYNAKTGEAILTGNYPSVSDGNTVMQCAGKNDFIRAYADGNLYFSGGIRQTIRNLDKQLSDHQQQKKSRQP